MSGTVRLQKFFILIIAAVAMTFVFASNQSHADLRHCSFHLVHADDVSDIPTDGSTGMASSAEDCCASACTNCVTSWFTLALAPDKFERAPIRVVLSSPLNGQIPNPGRHPPRSAA